MGSIKLKSTGSLRWPPLCVVCGSAAIDTTKSSIRLVTNPKYYIVSWGWTEQKYSIQVPVCEKHKSLCKFLDIPGFMGSVGSFLFLLVAPPVTSVFLLVFLRSIISEIPIKELQPVLEILSVSLAVIVFLSFYAFFIIASILTPVKICSLNENFLMLKIRNDNIFKIFKSLNADKTVS